jgi:hypothetical protein
MLEIVKRREAHNFVVLPKRWLVERTLAWITRHRRLARDFERYARSTPAFVCLAMIRVATLDHARPLPPESKLLGSALSRSPLYPARSPWTNSYDRTSLRD